MLMALKQNLCKLKDSFNQVMSILRGRQVWENGKYRHVLNGGTDPTYKNWDDYQFFDHVQHRWSYVFTELFYKTKLYSNGAKI